MKRPRWVIVTLVLLLTLVVIATPPTIDHLFDKELRDESYCAAEMPPGADGYTLHREGGGLTCFYTKNGKPLAARGVNPAPGARSR